MSEAKRDLASVFRIDVSPNASARVVTGGEPNSQVCDLLRQLIDHQNRTNELLNGLVEQMSAAQKQRANELGQWKAANPVLARRCRTAAEAISQVQTEFLQTMTAEINENREAMLEGDFVLNEFIDRYGPRLAHLNGVLQLLSQLSVGGNQANQT